MTEELQAKFKLIEEIAERNSQVLKDILPDHQVDSIAMLIKSSLIEYDAHMRVQQDKGNIEWRENMLKTVEGIPQDTPVYKDPTEEEIREMNIKELELIGIDNWIDNEEETEEYKAYRKGWMDGYDEGLYDGLYK